MLLAASSSFIEPCLPSAADRPPSGSNWIHEIKHDGYRLMARRDPNPDADDPTTRLGVRLKPRPVPRSDREELVGGYG